MSFDAVPVVCLNSGEQWQNQAIQHFAQLASCLDDAFFQPLLLVCQVACHFAKVRLSLT